LYIIRNFQCSGVKYISDKKALHVCLLKLVGYEVLDLPDVQGLDYRDDFFLAVEVLSDHFI